MPRSRPSRRPGRGRTWRRSIVHREPRLKRSRRRGNAGASCSSTRGSSRTSPSRGDVAPTWARWSGTSGRTRARRLLGHRAPPGAGPDPGTALERAGPSRRRLLNTFAERNGAGRSHRGHGPAMSAPTPGREPWAARRRDPCPSRRERGLSAPWRSVPGDGRVAGMRVEESFAVAADGTRIWWRSAGQGSPAVILSDGISCAGYIWRHLFPPSRRGGASCTSITAATGGAPCRATPSASRWPTAPATSSRSSTPPASRRRCWPATPWACRSASRRTAADRSGCAGWRSCAASPAACSTTSTAGAPSRPHSRSSRGPPCARRAWRAGASTGYWRPSSRCSSGWRSR
jgi:hypothetical protein